MDCYEFPSADEWRDIFTASPFPSVLTLLRKAHAPSTNSAGTSIEAFEASVALSRLEIELHNRVVDVARSYVFMKYYHSLGIPDDRWYISPGREGQSVEYFPGFQERHFIVKGWFDYYADTFYQKLFAALAVVGHVLNQAFSLGLKEKQVDFEPAVKALGPSVGEIRATLTGLIEDSAFVKARALRNDITHNESPSSVGMTISKSETSKAVVYGMGMRSYETSTAILGNASESVALLRRTLEAVRPEAT
jgi:hypothetical protein